LFSHDSGAVPQPDVQVQKIENETARAVQVKNTSGPKKSLFEPHIPSRPGYGTQGKEVILWANYFEMIAPMDLMLFRYSIEIKANEAGRKPTGKKAKRIVELLIEEHFPQYRYSIATDYKSNLICRSELPIEEEEYRVQYRLEDEDEPSQNAQTYILRLQGTGAFAVSELMDYLTSSHASALFGSKEEIIQALNIVMGHYPKTVPQVFSVGANKHFALAPAASEQMSLGAGLQAIRGFFVSVRSATSRILFNIQVKHTACYEEGPLGRLMSVYLARNGGNVVKLGSFLKRVRVRVTHIVRRNRAGCEIPRTKAITSLAMTDDGKGLQHPPNVPRFAAGPKEVEFFLRHPGEQTIGSQQSLATKKGKKGKKHVKEGPEPSSGRYISVYNFFQNSMCLSVSAKFTCE
jgi:eukaryotic translation initiation factor 2C